MSVYHSNEYKMHIILNNKASNNAIMVLHGNAMLTYDMIYLFFMYNEKFYKYNYIFVESLSKDGVIQPLTIQNVRSSFEACKQKLDVLEIKVSAMIGYSIGTCFTVESIPIFRPERVILIGPVYNLKEYALEFVEQLRIEFLNDRVIDLFEKVYDFNTEKSFKQIPEDCLLNFIHSKSDEVLGTHGIEEIKRIFNPNERIDSTIIFIEFYNVKHRNLVSNFLKNFKEFYQFKKAE